MAARQPRQTHDYPKEPARQGRLVAVWGPTGAPGRSTVALNAAAEAAAAGAKVILIDADTLGASLAQMLGLIDDAPGLAAACRSAANGTMDRSAFAALCPEVSRNLRVLGGITRVERWIELRPPALELVWQHCRENADLVIVDIGFGIESDEELSYDTIAPRRYAAAFSALAAADDVIAVAAAEPVGLVRLARALPDLAELHTAKLHVTVNKLRPSSVGSSPRAQVDQALKRHCGVEEAHYIPLDQARLDAAVLAGGPVREIDPKSQVCEAVAELVQAVSPGIGGNGIEPGPKRRRARERRVKWKIPGRSAPGPGGASGGVPAA